MKRTLLLTCFLLLSFININAQWKKLNFSSLYTYTIEMHDTMFYIGAHDGVYRSKDFGQAWHPFMNGIGGSAQVYSFKEIDGHFYVCCSLGAFRLSPDQNNWEVFCSSPAAASIIKINNEFIIGSWGNNISRSTNNGLTWTNEWENNQEIFNFISLIEWNGLLYAGTSRGIFISDNAARSWTRTDSLYLSKLEVINNKLYASTQLGVLQKNSPSGEWENLGLYHYNPQDVNILDNKIFTPTNLGFYVKTDKSESWLPGQQGDFGPGEQQVVQTLTFNDKLYLLTVKNLWIRDLYEFDLPALSVDDFVYDNTKYSVGEEFDFTAVYANNGFDTLFVENIICDNPEFEIFPRSFNLAPDASLGFRVKVKAKNPGWLTVDCKIISNDTVHKNTFTLKTNVLPVTYTLYQNYPNPFNPDTKVVFYTEKEEQVTLKIFNVLGAEVKTVINEIMSGGIHTANINAYDLSSGVYYYQLISGNYTAVKKMILLR